MGAFFMSSVGQPIIAALALTRASSANSSSSDIFLNSAMYGFNFNWDFSSLSIRVFKAIGSFPLAHPALSGICLGFV